MIDYGLFMMIYKPSKLIYSSVHIDRIVYIILYVDHFSRIPLYTYISFDGPVPTSLPHALLDLPDAFSLIFARVRRL